MYDTSNLIKRETKIFGRGCEELRQSPIVDHLVHYRNMFSAPESFIKRKVDYSRMRVFNEKYRKEEERLLTFKKFPQEKQHLINGLVKAGFYCIENVYYPDQVKCIFCQGMLENWSNNDVPMKRHKYSYPTCPFVISLNVANEPMPSTILRTPQENHDIDKLCKSGIVELKCLFITPRVDSLFLEGKINCLEFDFRENTFVNHLTLKHLAKGGLFVKKQGNESFLECCRCEKSTMILSGAEKLPESIFHKKGCVGLLPIKEDREECESDVSTKYCKVEYSVTTQEIEARLETSLIHELLHNSMLKVSKDDIKSIIEKRLKTYGKDFESLYEFLKAIKRFEKEGKSIPEEKMVDSEVALADFQCVVCMDKPVSVIFLPCGHLKTCDSCASAMVTCPVCRVMIERRVRDVRFNDRLG